MDLECPFLKSVILEKKRKKKKPLCRDYAGTVLGWLNNPQLSSVKSASGFNIKHGD